MPNLRPLEGANLDDKVYDLLDAQFDNEEFARLLEEVSQLGNTDQNYVAYELVNTDNEHVLLENLKYFPEVQLDEELAERLHMKGVYDKYKHLFEEEDQKEKEVA